MSGTKSIWYRLGHALERARHAKSAPRPLPGLAERRGRNGTVARRSDERPPLPAPDDLVAAGVAMAVDRVLASWTGRTPPGFARLVRAGAAGAAAALLLDLTRPLVTGRADRPLVDARTTERMLAGVGQGLVYGSIVEPRVPGPPLLKGAFYGSAEYWSDPVGGLSGLFGGHAPLRHVPLLGALVETDDDEERAYLEHLVFGVALALIYGSRSDRSGIEAESS